MVRAALQGIGEAEPPVALLKLRLLLRGEETSVEEQRQEADEATAALPPHQEPADEDLKDTALTYGGYSPDSVDTMPATKNGPGQ